MNPQDLRERLEKAASLGRFFADEVLERIPWIFAGDATAFEAWRVEAAAAAGLDARSLHIVGSAATGYSLSPLKPGRPFRSVAGRGNPSDIDIAIVDAG